MTRYRDLLVVLFALTVGFAVNGFSAEVYVVPNETFAAYGSVKAVVTGGR